MACVFESSDNGLVAKPHEGVNNWNSQELVNELNRVQTMLPQLTKDGLAAARTLLQEQKLLPDFEIVASRDADGRVRDEDGRLVQLTEGEMTAMAQQDLNKQQEAIGEPFSDGQFAFDRFSKGKKEVDQNNLLDQARISQDDISTALQLPNLSTKEREGLIFLKDNWEQLKAADPYYANESLSASALSTLKQQSLAPGEAPPQIGKYSTIREDVIFDSQEGYSYPTGSTQAYYDTHKYHHVDNLEVRDATETEQELAIYKLSQENKGLSPGLYTYDNVENADIYSLLHYEDPSLCQTNVK